MPAITALLLLTGTLFAQAPQQIEGFGGRAEAMQHARNSYEFAQRGDLAGAAEEMRAAIRAAPENPLYLSGLGGIAARQGNLQESKDCFESAVKLDPGNPVLRARLESISLDLGAELARQGRFKAGLVLAQDTARRFSESAPAQQMLGLFAARNQQNVAAVKAYQRALALAPEANEISVGLGIAQTMAGQLPDAVRTFEAGIRKWPSDAMHYQAYGVLLLRMAETGAAAEERGIQMLSKALELDPSLTEAHYRLGNLALASGDLPRAIEHLLAALSNGEQSSKVHFALSRAYRAAGKIPEAEKFADLFRRRQEESKQ